MQDEINLGKKAGGGEGGRGGELRKSDGSKGEVKGEMGGMQEGRGVGGWGAAHKEEYLSQNAALFYVVEKKNAIWIHVIQIPS